MKLRTVQTQLEDWDELLVTMGTGKTYRLMQGDSNFDLEREPSQSSSARRSQSSTERPSR